jgi:hypothetical protein
VDKAPEVKLDNEVRAFRDALDAWITERKGREFIPADTWVQWAWTIPDFPPDPLVRNGKIEGKEREPTAATLMRRNLIRMGEPYWNWERPASYQMGEVFGAANGSSVLRVGEEAKGGQQAAAPRENHN